MRKLQANVKQLLADAGLSGKVTRRQYRGKSALKLVIPINTAQKWTDAHREKLNQLCAKISAMGLRWAAEYKGMDHLTLNNEENGAPWMLFNGGEAIDLIPEALV